MKIVTKKRTKGMTADEYIDSIYKQNQPAIDAVLGPKLREGQSAKSVFRGLVKNAQEDLRSEGKRADIASAAKVVGRRKQFDPNKSYAAENFISGLQRRGRLDEFAELADLRIQKRISGRFAGYTKGQKEFDPSKLVSTEDGVMIYANKVRIDYDPSLDQIVFTLI